MECQDFEVLFHENLSDIYEFDATEIQDLLLRHEAEADDKRRSDILSTRKLLCEQVCEQFPSLQNQELYNRRKMAIDVYVFGNAVVNKLLDKRLNKVFKFTRGPLQSQHGLDDTFFHGNLVDNEDLLQTCVDLQNAVTILQQTVKDLTNNVTAFHQQIEVHDHHVPQVALTGNLLGRGTDNHNQNQQNHIRERNLAAQGDQTDESKTTSINGGVASDQWQVNQLQDNQPQSNSILPP